jgi:hypothetical protein
VVVVETAAAAKEEVEENIHTEIVGMTGVARTKMPGTSKHSSTLNRLNL